MIGNVALDVVIGLVFVYLLYSLYATVIMEMISSLLGLRGKNLDYAIKRMLKDEKSYPNEFAKRSARVITSFLQMAGRAINLKNSKLYDNFFQQRSIQNLSSGGVNNKPSYLSADDFVKGIIDSVKTKDDELSLLANIKQGLKDDPTSSARVVRTGAEEHIKTLLDDANNDLVKFKILLEGWFNNTMDRASGWYKRSVQIILFFTGLFLAITFNVDTMAIIKKLSTDKDAREQLVKMAVAESGKLPVPSEPDLLKPASSKPGNIDSLKVVQEMLLNDIYESQNILSSNWNVSSKLHVIKANKEPHYFDSVFIKRKIIKPGSTDTIICWIAVHKSLDLEIVRGMLPVFLEKEYVVFDTFSYKWQVILKNFLGYLLTAIAISLGSPFWFDLLNKLVKLKTSKGVSASEEKSDGKSKTSANREILSTIG